MGKTNQSPIGHLKRTYRIKKSTQIINLKLIIWGLLKELKECESSDVPKNIEIIAST